MKSAIWLELSWNQLPFWKVHTDSEQVADWFLSERPDYALDPVQPGELAAEIPIQDGRVRVLPGTFEAEGGADGFFVARFRRLSRG